MTLRKYRGISWLLVTLKFGFGGGVDGNNCGMGRLFKIFFSIGGDSSVAVVWLAYTSFSFKKSLNFSREVDFSLDIAFY